LSDTAETFWERFIASYRFNRAFGELGRWQAFVLAVRKTLGY
jgi:hypothetical protein